VLEHSRVAVTPAPDPAPPALLVEQHIPIRFIYFGNENFHIDFGIAPIWRDGSDDLTVSFRSIPRDCPREFDMDEALNKAVPLLCERGSHGTLYQAASAINSLPSLIMWAAQRCAS
jgi:hypothetical protein